MEDKDKFIIETTRQVLGRLVAQLEQEKYWQVHGDFQTAMRRLTAELTRELGPELGTEANAVYLQVVDLVSRLGWYGPIHHAMSEKEITDIRINSPYRPFLFIKEGKKHEMPVKVSSEWIRYIVTGFRRQRNLGAAGLPVKCTGAVARPPMRYTFVSGIFGVGGDSLYIRKFRRYPLKLIDQIETGVLTPEAADFLDMAVKARLNLIVSGGSNAGKTTLLTTLALSIPRAERVVTVEDEHEIYLEESELKDFLPFELNREEQPATDMSELLRNVALKVAPDRVIVGEVRGKEAYDLMQAMNIGVDGSMATLHANSPADALTKLADYVMMSDNPPPLEIIYSRIAAQHPLVVQISLLPDGKRMVTGIAECLSTSKTTFETQQLFVVENGRLWRTRTPYSQFLAARIAPIKELLEVKRSRVSRIEPAPQKG